MDKEYTLVEHLEELRRRIIVSLAAVAVAAAASYPFSGAILKFLKTPAEGIIEKLVFFSPQEAFLIYLKISFFTGLLITVPVILYQVWAFVSPAVDEKIRRSGFRFLSMSLTAFMLGGAFAFFVLIPAAVRFLLSFAGDALQPMISASNYISFVLALTLGCGAVFEMPVLSYLLSALGVVNPGMLRSKWKYAVVVIFIASAIITPTTDIFNMMILAIPMLLLYEVSIWVSRLSYKKRAPVA